MSPCSKPEVRRLRFPHECPGGRCRRHAREDPGDGPARAGEVPVGTDAYSQTDGRRGPEARAWMAVTWCPSVIPDRSCETTPLRSHTTWAPDGSGSTSKKHSDVLSNWSMMRQCKHSEVTSTGKCSFSAWGP